METKRTFIEPNTKQLTKDVMQKLEKIMQNKLDDDFIKTLQGPGYVAWIESIDKHGNVTKTHPDLLR